MAMKDINFGSGVKLAGFKSFAAADGTTAFTGPAVDTLGFNAVLLTVSATYSATDVAKYTLTVQESDDNSTYTDAPAGVLIGPAGQLSGSDTVQKIGYVGERRYVKLVVTPSATASSTNTITVVAHAVLQSPYVAPVA